jgi:hypothetical protein
MANTSKWWINSRTAKLLGIPPYEVTRACENGELRSIGKHKKRRIDPTSILEWIEDNRSVHMFRERDGAKGCYLSPNGKPKKVIVGYHEHRESVNKLFDAVKTALTTIKPAKSPKTMRAFCAIVLKLRSDADLFFNDANELQNMLRYILDEYESMS